MKGGKRGERGYSGKRNNSPLLHMNLTKKKTTKTNLDCLKNLLTSSHVSECIRFVEASGRRWMHTDLLLLTLLLRRPGGEGAIEVMGMGMGMGIRDRLP